MATSALGGSSFDWLDYDPTFNLPKLRGCQSIMREVWEMLIDNCDADHHLN